MDIRPINSNIMDRYTKTFYVIVIDNTCMYVKNGMVKCDCVVDKSYFYPDLHCKYCLNA